MSSTSTMTVEGAEGIGDNSRKCCEIGVELFFVVNVTVIWLNAHIVMKIVANEPMKIHTILV